MENKRRVGVLGGTFDPIHFGHLAIAEEVRCVLGLDEIVFIPTGQPPHKARQQTTPVLHRLTMVQLAIVSNPHFSISRVEIERAGPSYLVDTLRQLRAAWGEQTEIFFIIGWDSLKDFPGWYDAKGILDLLTALVAVPRPGFFSTEEYNRELEARLPGLSEHLEIVSGPYLEIASRELRQRVREGRPIRYQVPDAVADYINAQKLYQQPVEKGK